MSTRYLLRTLRLTTIIVVGIFLIRSFVAEPGRVNGRSMEPTFYDHESFAINKFLLLFRQPKRGEIVQLTSPRLGDLVIKRIIGLPGETVHIQQNSVFITAVDGSYYKLDESYLPDNSVTRHDDGNVSIGPLSPFTYYLLGDNRYESGDSREYGPVHRSAIYGTVIKLPSLN